MLKYFNFKAFYFSTFQTENLKLNVASACSVPI